MKKKFIMLTVILSSMCLFGCEKEDETPVTIEPVATEEPTPVPTKEVEVPDISFDFDRDLETTEEKEAEEEIEEESVYGTYTGVCILDYDFMTTEFSSLNFDKNIEIPVNMTMELIENKDSDYDTLTMSIDLASAYEEYRDVVAKAMYDENMAEFAGLTDEDKRMTAEYEGFSSFDEMINSFSAKFIERMNKEIEKVSESGSVEINIMIDDDKNICSFNTGNQIFDKDNKGNYTYLLDKGSTYFASDLVFTLTKD